MPVKEISSYRHIIFQFPAASLNLTCSSINDTDLVNIVQAFVDIEFFNHIS